MFENGGQAEQQQGKLVGSIEILHLDETREIRIAKTHSCDAPCTRANSFNHHYNFAPFENSSGTEDRLCSTKYPANWQPYQDTIRG